MAPRSSAKYAFEWHHPRVLEIVENNNRVSMRQTSGDTSAPVEALGFLGMLNILKQRNLRIVDSFSSCREI